MWAYKYMRSMRTHAYLSVVLLRRCEFANYQLAMYSRVLPTLSVPLSDRTTPRNATPRNATQRRHGKEPGGA